MVATRNISEVASAKSALLNELKPNNVITVAASNSIKKDGADYICDGTNDEVEIQTAIDSLPETGGSIFLLPGNFSISSVIVIDKSYVTVTGCGRGTVLISDNNNDVIQIGNINKPVQVAISDMRFYSDSENGIAIKYSYSTTMLTHNIVDNVYIELFDYGFYIDGSSDMQIVNSVVQEANYGIYLQNATALTVNGGLYRHIDNICIWIDGGFEHMIDGVQMAVPKGTGIYLKNVSYSNIVSVHTFKLALGGASGIHLVGCSSINIVGFLSGEGSGNGIHLDATENSVENISISSSKFDNLSGDGILLSNSGTLKVLRLVVANNVFKDLDGIAINNTCNTIGENYTFLGNVVNNCLYGIRLLANVLGFNITGNSFYNIVRSAIYSSSPFWTNSSCSGNSFVYNNKSNSSGEGDIRIEPTGSIAGNIAITGNSFRFGLGNPKFGINLGNKGLSCVQSNDFYDYNDIAVVNSPSGSLIAGNRGYIKAGEIREASGSLVGGNANAFSFAWQNPEFQSILILEVIIDIVTAGGTAGALIDVGSADNATTGNNNLLNDIDANASAISVSTERSVKLDAKDGTTDYVTGQILIENAASLSGNFYIKYMGV